jgi:hypothetical protein
MSSPDETGLPARRDEELLVAEAIFHALKRRNPNAYVSGNPAPHQKTTIDGQFYLLSVARQVLKAMGR